MMYKIKSVTSFTPQLYNLKLTEWKVFDLCKILDIRFWLLDIIPETLM